MSDPWAGRRVVVCCDVGPRLGVGHLLRCVALSEEFLDRGAEVIFAADASSVPWAAEQLARRDIATVVPPASPSALLDLVSDLEPDVTVVDSYLLPSSFYEQARARGLRTLALVDGEVGGRTADVYLDQNIGAETADVPVGPGEVRLAGLRFALMRDDVRARRPESLDDSTPSSPPAVLGFFGGTDALGVAPLMTRVLAESGRPFNATIVATTEESRCAVGSVEMGPGQRVDVIPPTPDLAGLVRRADLALSAAGTSTWELMCLGAAAGLVCVADNQEESYARVVASGAVAGVGRLHDLRTDHRAAVTAVRRLLDDPAWRRSLASRGWQLVDGRGRERVVFACERLLA